MGGLPKWFPPVYALVVTLGAFAYLAYAGFGPPVDESQRDIVQTVVGFLLGVALTPIIGYVFGSSAGSKDKQEMLRRDLTP